MCKSTFQQKDTVYVKDKKNKRKEKRDKKGDRRKNKK